MSTETNKPSILQSTYLVHNFRINDLEYFFFASHFKLFFFQQVIMIDHSTYTPSYKPTSIVFVFQVLKGEKLFLYTIIKEALGFGSEFPFSLPMLLP